MRLLQQMPALILFKKAATEDCLLAAKTILEKLKNPSTRLYHEFSEYVLPPFTNLNKEMHWKWADFRLGTRIHLLHGKLSGVLKFILEFYIKPEYSEATPMPNVRFKDPSNFLALDEMYLGAKPIATLADNMHGLDKTQVHNFRLLCRDFLIEAAQQIHQRLPLKSKQIKELRVPDPKIVVSKDVPSIAPLAMSFPLLLPASDINNLDREWRLLQNTDLMPTACECVCCLEVPEICSKAGSRCITDHAAFFGGILNPVVFQIAYRMRAMELNDMKLAVKDNEVERFYESRSESVRCFERSYNFLVEGFVISSSVKANYARKSPGKDVSACAPQKDVCGSCEARFYAKQQFLVCSAGCNRRFHCKCLNVTHEEYNFYMKSGTSAFKCSGCTRRSSASPRNDAAAGIGGVVPAPVAFVEPPNVTLDDGSVPPALLRLIESLSSKLDIVTAEVKCLRADNNSLRSEVLHLRKSVHERMPLPSSSSTMYASVAALPPAAPTSVSRPRAANSLLNAVPGTNLGGAGLESSSSKGARAAGGEDAVDDGYTTVGPRRRTKPSAGTAKPSKPPVPKRSIKCPAKVFMLKNAYLESLLTSVVAEATSKDSTSARL
ncbi:hypothetical protein HPB47_018584 [Ixodes persulcatus]|uniref:Uncharacterized protein n=1 Tax=Ixodes persulcatus TaxID=34615 RepID=A0AC60QKC9_IXOPE|nr:hypothetical protein HPB47_018584 [Ixodes persulcatus]